MSDTLPTWLKHPLVPSGLCFLAAIVTFFFQSAITEKITLAGGSLMIEIFYGMMIVFYFSWEEWKTHGMGVFTKLHRYTGGHSTYVDPDLQKTKNYQLLVTGGFFFMGFIANGKERVIVIHKNQLIKLNSGVVITNKIYPVDYELLPDEVKIGLKRFDSIKKLKDKIYVCDPKTFKPLPELTPEQKDIPKRWPINEDKIDKLKKLGTHLIEAKAERQITQENPGVEK